MKNLIRLTVGFLVFSLSIGAINASIAHAQEKNAHQASKKAGALMLMSSGLSYGAGAFFGYKCASGLPPVQAWACPAAATSIAQAISHGGRSAEAYKSAAASLCQENPIFCKGSGDSSSDTTDPYASTGGGNADLSASSQSMNPKMVELRTQLSKVDAILKKSQDLQTSLADKGYVFNPANNSVTTPSGKSISAEALNSTEGMKGMGMTPSDIQEVKTELARIASMKNFDVNFTGGGGGSLGSAVAANRDPSFNMNDFMRGINGGRKPASDLAGLKKYIGSEPIGVSVDNIFDMVSRQYKTQAGQGAFLP